MKQKLLTLILVIGMSACAVPEQKDPHESRGTTGDWDPAHCNEQGGYERGFNDGRSGLTMNSQFSSRCRQDLKVAAQQGYQKGFEEGKKIWEGDDRDYQKVSMPQPGTYPPVQAPPPVNEGKATQVNINIGGKQVVGNAGNSDGTLAQNSKAYFCSIKKFGKTYESFGATRLEAETAVKNLCAQENNRMFCERAQCQTNP